MGQSRARTAGHLTERSADESKRGRPRPIAWKRTLLGLTFALERVSFYPYERPYSPVFWKLTIPGLSFHGGQFISAMKRPWFSVLPPHGFGLLTVTGRKTGRRRHMCVRAIPSAGRIYLVAIAGAQSAWANNIRANPRVWLRVRGAHLTGRARVLDDPRELEQAARVYCERLNPFDYVECVIHRPGLPSSEKISDLHRGWCEHGTPVVIELDRATAV